MWVVTDSASNKNSSFEQKLLTGIVQEAQSVKEMADAMGVSESVLTRTLDNYNKDVKNQSRLSINKSSKHLINKEPFYFGRERFDIHFCCGGLAINNKGEVLGKDGNPIAGLYAAGECTGGIHGKDRLGGDSLISCFVFGRIAGASSAAYVS